MDYWSDTKRKKIESFLVTWIILFFACVIVVIRTFNLAFTLSGENWLSHFILHRSSKEPAFHSLVW